MTIPLQADPVPLDYESSAVDRRRPGNPTPLLVVSAACLLVPWVGLMLQSGLLFLAGLPLSLVGLATAGGAFLSSRRAAADFVMPALLAACNGLALAYFFTLIFVHGLC